MNIIIMYYYNSQTHEEISYLNKTIISKHCA